MILRSLAFLASAILTFLFGKALLDFLSPSKGLRK